MNETSPPERAESESGPSAIAIGGILVVVGAILLVGQLLDIGLDDLGWPLIIVAIGTALLVIGLLVAAESGMVIGGAVVTTVGLVLFYQDQTDRWESWAYAWALVGPAASGLGLALWGLRSGNGGDVRNGTWGLLGGLAIFAIGFLFFEAVIAIGVVVLLRGMIERREA